MNPQELNTALVAIIQKKQQLSKLDYNDERYDDIEEELHDMEDEFNENYGDYLEDVLEDVHLKVCPDTDVLLPTAYLPDSLNSENGHNPKPQEGVWVEADKYPNREARITLVPNPARLVLTVGKAVQEEIWKA